MIYDHYLHWKLRIWSELLKKLLMENFIFCAVLRLHLPLKKLCQTSKIERFAKDKILHLTFITEI